MVGDYYDFLINKKLKAKKVCKFLKVVLLASWQKKVGNNLKAEIGKREENKTNRLQN